MLAALPDDLLIHIFSFLNVPDILCFRQTCRRINGLSSLRIIWLNACTTNILEKFYPFPSIALDTISEAELERRTRHAYRLSLAWLSPPESWRPRTEASMQNTPATPISDIHFVPGREGRWLLTVSKGIWSVITLWDLLNGPSKVSEWSPKGAIFTGFVVNNDVASEGVVAIGTLQDSWPRVEMLSIEDGKLVSITQIDTPYKPVTLQGDLLAISSDLDRTIIYNWRTGAYATLESSQQIQGVLQHDNCMHVVFAHKSILVVRSRHIDLFPEPHLHPGDRAGVYEPLVRHSFGWIDGVSVALSPPPKDPQLPYPPLWILVRSESDNPWTSDRHTIDLYALDPNPTFDDSPTFADASSSSSLSPMSPLSDSTTDDLNIPPILIPVDSADVSTASSPHSPYTFPPLLKSRVHSLRGALRCTDLFLGGYGTAVWIRPRQRANIGLLASPPHEALMLMGAESRLGGGREDECLVVAAFPGPLNPRAGHTEIEAEAHVDLGLGVDAEADAGVGGVEERRDVSSVLFRNELNNWTSLDYDEDRGRVAVGSSFGKVTVFELC